MNLPIVDRIVNALLYEGYILYPYRASAVKNQLRFNFGVVYPRAYAEAQSGNDAWAMQTECLVECGSVALLEICVRFLRVVNREGSENEQNWQEAVECRVNLPVSSVTSLAASPLRHELLLPYEQVQPVAPDVREPAAGAVVRTRQEIRGVVEASAEAVQDEVWRIRVRIVNSTELPMGSETSREAALGRSLISTHTVLGIVDGAFISLLEPLPELREAVSACRNEGTWPVLVGTAGERDTILSSPIFLYDYPVIAPESPGELCDSTEIDEILTLRVLTMTDREKDEARSTDERARRIIDRAESLGPEQFSKLHGTFRELLSKDAGGTP